MSIVNWFKKAYKTVEIWFKERGLKNAGWLIAFVLLYMKTGFPSIPILAAVGLVFLGIFIEKNRKSLVEIYKDLKEKAISAVDKKDKE